MDIHVLANNMYDFKKNTRHMYKQIGITTKPVFLRKVGKDQISVMILKTTLLPHPLSLTATELIYIHNNRMN